MATIMANISPRILSKAGHMFSNSLSDIFVELFQNARRAGATQIDVHLRAIENGKTEITVTDNGSGIEDFSSLLCLGDSKWDAATERAEDPAGMGFFSLLHSGATVKSNGQQAVITTQAFEGKEPVEVVTVSWHKGTTIRFDRKDAIQSVKEAVLRAAKYGPVDVSVDGETAPHEDFLKDAMYIKETMGVRIGVFVASAYSNYSDRWNFHGKTIREQVDPKGLSSVLIHRGKYTPIDFLDLNVRIDVIETSSVHLKLPDRNGIVQDDQYHQVIKEARRAMFEYLATLPEHTASYADFLEARELGIALREAAPYFTAFTAPAAAADSTDGPFLGAQEVVLLPDGADLTRYTIVDTSESKCTEWLLFTFDVAARILVQDVPLTMLEDNRRFVGYSWYGKLPRICPVHLAVNGEIHEDEFQGEDAVALADTLSLGLQLRSSDTVEHFAWDIPFAGWFEDSNFPSVQIVVTRSSAWLVKRDAEPFGLLEAAVYVGFQPGDDMECDSYDTQLEYFQHEAEEEITRILYGPMDLVQMKLNELASKLNCDYRNSLKNADVSRLVFVLGKDDRWSFTIQTGAAAVSGQAMA